MKVFISWSGERSKAVASALHEWIPDVIQSVQPWMSDQDISAGTRWASVLSKQLEETRFGIVCVTPENMGEPWIHFEAGSLAKQVREAFVCPYLFDLEPTQIPQGPLAQFQAKQANKTGTKELLESLNGAMEEGKLSPDRLQRTFARFWPNLEEELGKVPPTDVTKQLRTSEDMIPEILELVRGLDRRMPENLLLAVQRGARREALSKAFLGNITNRYGSRVIPIQVAAPCAVCNRPIEGEHGIDWVVRSSDSREVHTSCLTPSAQSSVEGPKS